MNYAITYWKVAGGFKGQFLDFPELSVTAQTTDEVQEMAYDALIGKLMACMDAGRVPMPKQEPNPSYVALLPSIAAKVLLHNLALDQNKSRSWIASQMGVTRQVMTRLFNLRETTKVETIQNALNALGYQMQIAVTPCVRNVSF
ncbi:type II toxin-antitoxin system HicB family antitoxin [Escherichia coli]